MSLTTERKGEVVIVQVGSGLTLGCGLRGRMKELAQTGAKCVLLDLADVADIESAGLGELVAAHTSLAKAGGIVMLLNVSHRVKEVLRFTRLCSAFATYGDVASAVRSFLANRPPVPREAEQCMRSEVYIG
ncbi:MAG: anti-sigma-factor antagonist [Bryobacterales bacterium]|nr:anti-sigma-factor antagonist [Bryobacterales bacterium]